MRLESRRILGDGKVNRSVARARSQELPIGSLWTEEPETASNRRIKRNISSVPVGTYPTAQKVTQKVGNHVCQPHVNHTVGMITAQEGP